jgi:hypothetical protein
MKNYDIQNPTRAARVIYDGARPNQRQYHIGAGESRDGVALSDDIAEELIARTRGKGKENSDLLLTLSDEQPEHKEPDLKTTKEPDSKSTGKQSNK